MLRGVEDAERTARKLNARGFAALLSPVLDIRSTGRTPPEAAFDALLLSSSKGLMGMEQAPARLREIPMHCVGVRTAEIAVALGWSVRFVGGDALSLLPQLLAHYKEPKRFLYLAGRDRRHDLERGLAAAGHDIEILVTYEALAAESLTAEATAKLERRALHCVLHYSRRSTEIFLRLASSAALTDAVRETHHIALSRDVAVPLVEAGCAKIAIAAKPDEQHVLDALAGV